MEFPHPTGQNVRRVTSKFVGELKESPARLRSVVERILAGLGLIRTSGDGWTILPVAGRYRDPRAVWEPVLEETP